MSLDALLTRLRDVQAEVVASLQAEYFCEDLTPPAAAFGWDEQALRDFFERGGEEAPKPVPQLAAPMLTANDRPCVLLLGDSITEMGCHIETGKADLNGVLLFKEVAGGMPAHIDAESGPGWGALLARDYGLASRADVVNRTPCHAPLRSCCADRHSRRPCLQAASAVTTQDGSSRICGRGY